jgi:riboflavin synthase alpha subunit
MKNDMRDIIKLLKEAVEKLEEKHGSTVMNGHILLGHYARAKEVHEINDAESKLQSEIKQTYHLEHAISKINKQVIRLEKL